MNIRLNEKRISFQIKLALALVGLIAFSISFLGVIFAQKYIERFYGFALIETQIKDITEDFESFYEEETRDYVVELTRLLKDNKSDMQQTKMKPL